MEPEIASLQGCVDLLPVVSRSVSALREGKLVVFPTETVYGLAALVSNAAAIERLCVRKGRRAGHAMSIAIAGADVLSRYAPEVSPLALNLAERFWPGPITLVLKADSIASELNTLPQTSLDAIRPESFVGFRVPQHEFLLQVLRKLDAPIALTSANLTGKTPAKSALEARDALGAMPDLIVDDGEARIGEPSTVIKIDGNRADILRQGAVAESVLREAVPELF